MTALSVADLTTQANTNIADNTTGDISALDVRDMVVDLAESAANITDLGANQAATGTGDFVLATSPTLVTPALGTPTSGNLSNCTALPVGSITGLGTGVATWLATPSSANLASAVTGETGSGALVFADTPTLTTPVLGAATGTSVTVTGLLQAGSTVGISTDALLSRRGAANWQLGAADAASAVAQTLTAQGVVAGTSNTAGADLSIAGSASTGNAAGGSVIFKVANAGSSGTSQNTPDAALTLAATSNGTYTFKALTPHSQTFVITPRHASNTCPTISYSQDPLWITGVIAIGATLDVGLARTSAGLLEVNSGSAGTLRDLRMRGLRTPMTGELTIAAGVITVTGSYHRIDTQSDDATDDLDTINGGADGMRLVIRAENDGRTVVVKDGTGNIQCAGDFSMDNTQDTMELIFDSTLSAWLEVGRSDNGA